VIHLSFRTSGSQKTHRWRELDSNFRFRARFGSVFVVSLLGLRFVAEAPEGLRRAIDAPEFF
jgi:hypothetical protein